MIEYVTNFFQTRNHKEIMLVSLLSLSIIIYMVLALAALYLGFNQIFWIKLTVSLFIALLLIPYLKSYHTSIIALLLFLILEVDSSWEMLNQHFYNFISIYPFCIIFGFFFFFRLGIALWTTLLHFIFWIFIIIIRDQPIQLSDVNIFVTSIVVVLLGIFYHLSTEIVYDNHKDEEKRKATILKEIHHRIKNNLNMIASIIGLQILNLEKNKSQDTKEILTKSKLRIEVVAMIHESLYQHKSIEEINFKEYTQKLLNLILQTYNEKVDIQIDSNITILHSETMLRLGIIINELFTNSIKHGFSDNNENKIHISLTKENEYYLFTYHNPHNINADIDKLLHSPSLGIKLINLTVKQMGGVLNVEQNGGLVFTIRFRV